MKKFRELVNESKTKKNLKKLIIEDDYICFELEKNSISKPNGNIRKFGKKQRRRIF